MQVKVKKVNPNLKTHIPKYAKPGDAAMDFTATSLHIEENGNRVYGTNLAIEIPEGYVGLLFPRSSLTKYDLILGNHVGVIDSGFRGEILFKFKSLIGGEDNEYNIGDRIGQLLILPYPQVELVEAAELKSSERGTGGYGSSGK